VVANPFPKDFMSLADFSAPDCRRLTVASVADLGQLTDQFAKDLAAGGFGDKEIFGIRLAVEEAVVNGIKHGHRGDPTKQVHIQYRITSDQVLLQIDDEGPGFHPDAIPDPRSDENIDKPGGRGVFLMRYYMTWVEFNERGNSVVMCKTRR
jgi:serine/threonine-protein kinase RsbW